MKKQFSVVMECKIRKLVTVECERIDQAQNNPFSYAIDEIETDMIDWDVISVSEDV